jgi:hypothetical protein
MVSVEQTNNIEGNLAWFAFLYVGSQGSLVYLHGVVAVLNVCNAGFPINQTALEDFLFHGNASVARYIEQASLGRFTMDKTTMVPFYMNMPCPGYSGGDCSPAPFQNWKNAMITAAETAGLQENVQQAQVRVVCSVMCATQ